MKKPKKLGKLATLRATVRAQVGSLANMAAKIGQQQQEIDRLNVQLGEARRRTIPMAGLGGGEVNFLPLGIVKIDIRHDTHMIHSASGYSQAVRGLSRATIEVDGETLTYIPGPPKK